ncbi:toxin-antitoxin system YwqK family antitoxin [Bacteroidota bacterium]
MNWTYLLFAYFIFISCVEKPIVINLQEDANSIEIKSRLLNYNHQLFTGELIDFYDTPTNSKPKLSCFYKEGEKHGIELKWHENGTINTKRIYKNNIKIGIHKAWWENGNPKFEYHFNDSGAYTGVLKEWFQTGQPYRFFNYENGREEGSQKMWKPNGAIQANYVIVNGERFGLIGLKTCDPVSTK